MKKANEEETKHDHVGEAEDWVRGLENDIDHLQKVRRSRNDDAKTAIVIDHANDKGQKWIDEIIRKLYGKE